MPIKNYTTSVPANRSIAEIQDALVKHGATGVLYKYEQGTGRIEALQFLLRVKNQDVAFSPPRPSPASSRSALPYSILRRVSNTKGAALRRAMPCPGAQRACTPQARRVCRRVVGALGGALPRCQRRNAVCFSYPLAPIHMKACTVE